jgi:AraC family transcriptional regulator, L-rhamnose operon transcriptional activator RhaR
MARRTRYTGRTLFSARHLPITASRHQVTGDLISHDHDFVEAVLILGGSGTHRTARGVQPLQAGDAFLLRPGAWHTFEGCDALVVYNCCFGIGLLRRELAGLLTEPTIHHLLVTGPLAFGGLLAFRLEPGALVASQARLEAIHALAESQDPLDGIEKIGLLIQFLAGLARAVAPAPETAEARSLHPAIQSLLARIEADPAREWNLPRLADTANLEKSYLTRIFKAATGLAPLAYVARARLELAASLLLRTPLSIREIAEQVGIADPNLFARRFRTHFGLSATAYRERFSPKA